MGLVYVAAHMPDAGESEAEDGKRFSSDLSKSTGGPPVSFTPFLEDVEKRLAHQYLLTFLAKPSKKANRQRIRLMTEVPNADLVGPGKVWVAP